MDTPKIKRPFSDRVLVRRDKDKESRTVISEKTGDRIELIIPDTAQGKLNTGIVLALGPAVEEKMGLVVGMHIMFGKYSGTEIDDLVLLRDEEIFAEIE